MFRLYEDKWIHGSKMYHSRLAQVNIITIKYLAFSGYILVKYYRPFGSLSAPQRNNCYLTTKVFFVHYHEQQKKKRRDLTELSVFNIYEDASLWSLVFCCWLICFHFHEILFSLTTCISGLKTPSTWGGCARVYQGKCGRYETGFNLRGLLTHFLPSCHTQQSIVLILMLFN